MFWFTRWCQLAILTCWYKKAMGWYERDENSSGILQWTKMKYSWSVTWLTKQNQVFQTVKQNFWAGFWTSFWLYKRGIAKDGIAAWQNFRSVCAHDRREVEGTGAQRCDWVFAKMVESREKRQTWQSLTEIVCVPLLLFKRHRLTAALSGRTRAYVVLMMWFRARCLSISLTSTLSLFYRLSLSLLFILPISSPSSPLSLSLSLSVEYKWMISVFIDRLLHHILWPIFVDDIIISCSETFIQIPCSLVHCSCLSSRGFLGLGYKPKWI